MRNKDFTVISYFIRTNYKKIQYPYLNKNYYIFNFNINFMK